MPVAGDPSISGFVANLAGNFSGAREAIAGVGAIDVAAVDRAVESITAFARLPDAMIGYAMPWVEGVRLA